MPRRLDFTVEPMPEHVWLLVNRGETLELRPACTDEALIAEWALENGADDRKLPRSWYPPDLYAKQPEWRRLPGDLKKQTRPFARAAAAGHRFWEMSGWPRLPVEAWRVVRGISRNYWKLNQDEEMIEAELERKRLRRSPIRHGNRSYSREEIAERCGRRCAKCGQPVQRFHLDHRRPLARGGRHTLRNIQLLCPRCNLKKGDAWDGSH